MLLPRGTRTLTVRRCTLSRFGAFVAAVMFGHLIAAAPIEAAKKARPAAQPRAIPAGAKRIADLDYTRTASGPLALDLYLPEATSGRPLPVIVWVHSGGWKNGSKLNCPLIWLAAEDFAVASLDVRLLDQSGWPAQIEDPRAGIRWLRENAPRYNLDPNRIAIGGGSSGGHVASIVGTTSPPAGETIPSRVQAVIDFYGPADLLTMPANTPGPNKTDDDLAKANGALLLGGIVRDRPQLARQASALHQVSRDDPPFLILHGDADPQVPVDQSRRLHAALQAAGVSSELHVLSGAGHGGKAFDTPEIRAVILAFLERTLRTGDR